MRNKIASNLRVAHLANEFALNGRIDFTNAREWIIFLYLVAQLDPKDQEELTESIIPISEIKKLLQKSGKHWGGLYHEINRASRRMAKAICEFDTDVYIEGKSLSGYFTIFGKIKPGKTKDGSVYITYKFNDEMKPLLLGFRRHFFGMTIPKGIKSAYAIRFLLYAKAEHDRRRKSENVISLMYFDLGDFKKMLGIEKKYSKRFNNLRDRVIKPIQEGVNQSGILEITDIDFIRHGRSITELCFHVKDAAGVKKVRNFLQLKENENTPPTSKEIERLTKAQLSGYEFIVNKGIYEGITYREIIFKMPSSECLGYEDEFLKLAWAEFEKRTKKTTKASKAGAFVKWYQHKVFTEGLFPHVIEQLCTNKKQKTSEQRTNREIAKNISSKEFEKYYKERLGKQAKSVFTEMSIQSNKQKNNHPSQKANFQSLGDITHNVLKSFKKDK